MNTYSYSDIYPDLFCGHSAYSFKLKKNPNSYQARANILNVDPKGGANIFQF